MSERGHERGSDEHKKEGAEREVPHKGPKPPIWRSWGQTNYTFNQLNTYTFNQLKAMGY